MNIITLLQQHPLLCADLENLGISRQNMYDAAAEITRQLGGNSNFNLCYVLAALNSKEFVRSVNSRNIAEQLNLSPCIAQSMVLLIAPWVERFELSAV